MKPLLQSLCMVGACVGKPAARPSAVRCSRSLATASPGDIAAMCSAPLRDDPGSRLDLEVLLSPAAEAG